MSKTKIGVIFAICCCVVLPTVMAIIVLTPSADLETDTEKVIVALDAPAISVSHENIIQDYNYKLGQIKLITCDLLHEKIQQGGDGQETFDEVCLK